MQVRKTVLLLLSLLLSAFLLEAALRGYFRVRPSYDIEMWKYATHLKEPVNDPRGHIHVSGRSMRLMGVDVSINSKGLRDREFAYSKPAGVFRILALGDSFTMGWGVPVEDTFSKRIEKILDRTSKVEVLNGGVGNYNTLQELTAYELEYSKYDPDLVLLCFYVNDAEPAQENKAPRFFPNSYLLAFLNRQWQNVQLLLNPKTRFDAYYNAQFEGDSWSKYEEVIARLAQSVQARHSKLVVALLPDFRMLDHYPFTNIHAKVKARFESLGVQVIDLAENLESSFDRRPSSRYWVAWDDPHPNADAHRIIAEKIADRLVKEGLIR